MRKVTIEIDDKDYEVLEAAANKRGVTVEQWARDAVHLLLSAHTIDYAGYENSKNHVQDELI